MHFCQTTRPITKFGTLTFYFIFISIRISFDGKKLTLYKFFLPVKSFSIRKIESVEYSPQTKYLFINRKYAFPCRLFPKKDIDVLLKLLSKKHGIKTGKIWKYEKPFLFSSTGITNCKLTNFHQEKSSALHFNDFGFHKTFFAVLYLSIKWGIAPTNFFILWT